MGSPPPTDYSTPSAADSGAEDPNLGVAAGEPVATVCGFGVGLPKLKIGLGSLNITLPSFPPSLPLPWFSFALSCDPSKPITLNGGIPFGGGRPKTGEPDPDQNENSA